MMLVWVTGLGAVLALFFRPFGAQSLLLCSTHALRRGLHSFAALRLDSRGRLSPHEHAGGGEGAFLFMKININT